MTSINNLIVSLLYGCVFAKSNKDCILNNIRKEHKQSDYINAINKLPIKKMHEILEYHTNCMKKNIQK